MSYLPNPSLELVRNFGQSCKQSQGDQGPFRGAMSTLAEEAPHLHELLMEARAVNPSYAHGILLAWAILRYQAEIDAGVREPGSVS